jgi:hypothetical protein
LMCLCAVATNYGDRQRGRCGCRCARNGHRCRAWRGFRRERGI